MFSVHCFWNEEEGQECVASSIIWMIGRLWMNIFQPRLNVWNLNRLYQQLSWILKTRSTSSCTLCNLQSSFLMTWQYLFPSSIRLPFPISSTVVSPQGELMFDLMFGTFLSYIMYTIYLPNNICGSERSFPSSTDDVLFPEAHAGLNEMFPELFATFPLTKKVSGNLHLLLRRIYWWWHPSN